MEQEQKPKKKSRLLLGIILVLIALVVVLPIVASVMGLLSPVFLSALFNNFNDQIEKTASPSSGSLFKATTTYKPTVPETIAKSAVSKVISAKDGGNIKLTDSNGVETDLFFFPGSFDQDTKITVTPLKKFPLENYGKTITPGVLIEPKDAQFKNPAILTFTFPQNKKESLIPESILGINTANAQSIPITPALPGNDATHFEIFELAPIGLGANNPGGGAIISSNDVSRTSGVVSSTPAQDGSSVTGPVSSGGSYAPDNVDGQEAGNFSNSGTSSGSVGNCDQETANLVKYAMANDGRSENMQDYRVNQAYLSRCSEDILKSLKEKCQNNKMEVRRKDFQLLVSLFRTLGNDGKIEETRSLMNGCTARYSATGSHTLGSGVGGTATTQVSAEVCGFIDDVWKGSYSLITAVETISSDITFSLPAKGGAVYQNHKGSASGAVNMSIAAGGITGYYNGKNIFTQDGARLMNFPVSIALVSAPCNR